jgi:hypothetical protein
MTLRRALRRRLRWRTEDRSAFMKQKRGIDASFP